jgi:hypothetical protein
MADPEFVPKVWQIQEYWRSAALAAISRQAEPGTRHDRLAAWPAGPQPAGERGRSPAGRRHHHARLRWLGIFSDVMFALAGIGAVAVLIAGPLAMGPAIRAARGHGTAGTFTAQSQECPEPAPGRDVHLRGRPGPA